MSIQESGGEAFRTMERAGDHMLATARRQDRDESKSLPPAPPPPSNLYHLLPPTSVVVQPPQPPISSSFSIPPPPSYDHRTFSFPDAPTTELAPIHQLQLHHHLHHNHNSHRRSGSTTRSGVSHDSSSSTNTLPSFSALTDSLSPRNSTGTPPTSIASPRDSVVSVSDNNNSLPSLIRSPPITTTTTTVTTSWPSLNPLTTYYTPSHAISADSPAKMDVEMTGTRAGSVSLDDPDVRMAAEALGDLRADFVSTTPQPPPEPLLQLVTASHPLLAKTVENTSSLYNSSKNFSPRFKTGAEYVEGYLTPISNAVGSVGRVTGVEGGVRWFYRSRRQPAGSDLESGSSSRNKRRKVGSGSASRGSTTPGGVGQDRMAMGVGSPELAPDLATSLGKPLDFDPYAFSTKERRTSMSTVDTLPAYDGDYRSPAYTAEDQEGGPRTPTRGGSSSPNSTSPWKNRLVVSASGLSIAMSEESLRSLKYCLEWLRWANEHIAKVIGNLKETLDQYDHSQQQQQLAGAEEGGAEGDAMLLDQDHPAAAPAEPRIERIPLSREAMEKMSTTVTALKADVLKTLRAVIETVSKYAGGALPDNARILVRRHLTSLPQRFRLASQQGPSTTTAAAADGGDVSEGDEKEVLASAQRVLLLAQEGLDMMAQVSGVLDGTIVSAEEWCVKLGKKKQEERAALMARVAGGGEPMRVEPFLGVGIDSMVGDVKMGGSTEDVKTGGNVPDFLTGERDVKMG